MLQTKEDILQQMRTNKTRLKTRELKNKYSKAIKFYKDDVS